MNSSVTANDLKIRGVQAIEQALKDGDEALVSVRGRDRYVVMDIEKYNQLRELELAAAVQEAKAEYKAGHYTSDIKEHMKDIRGDV